MLRIHALFPMLFSTAFFILLAACEGPQPAERASEHPIPREQVRGRLPEPPAQTSPVPQPPPAATPSTLPRRTPPPAAPPVPQPSPAPRSWVIEWHIQCSDRGDIPNTQGLCASLHWPRDVVVRTDDTRIVYEWRKGDGKDKQMNARSGKPWGPIFKPSLAEMMEPENLQRHLDTMPDWIGGWVPRDFAGVVCIDIEQWDFKTDSFHTSPEEITKQRRIHGDKTRGELLSAFIEQTIARARQLRPAVREWGWWGLGSSHVGQLVWKKPGDPGGFNDILSETRRQVRLRAAVDAPMPVYYYPIVLGDDAAARRLSYDRLTECCQAMFTPEMLRDKGYCYVNCRHYCPDDRVNNGRLLTVSEFKEMIEAGTRAGMRKFILWDALESREVRNNLQRWIEEVFTPVARELRTADQPGLP